LALASLVQTVSPLAAEDLPSMNAHIQSNLRYLRIRMTGGRIQFTTIDPTRSSNTSTRNDDRQERLSLSYDSGLVTMAYEMTTPATQITFNVTDGTEVIVRRQPQTGPGGTHVEFIQPAAGQLTLRVDEGEKRRLCRAETFWHLLLAEPELCREHLAPLLELVRPGWQLAQSAPLVEVAMRRKATLYEPRNRRELATLVAALGSDEYSRREAAERELRAGGQMILPFLRGVDRSRLDAEQSYRLRGIIGALGNEDAEDTADRVANWLAGDPRAWYSLLNRDDPALRLLAAQQLSRLLELPIKFDASADAAKRQAQVKVIAEQIEQAWRF
jgi:hypothetical protein